MPRSFKEHPLHNLKGLGASIGNQLKDIDHLKKKGGLLPSVDRTRGAMSPTKAHIANFSVNHEVRKVALKLAFYPIHRQFTQGAHGNNTVAPGSWPARFIHKTRPGQLLLAFIATQGDVFDNTGRQIDKPTLYTFDEVLDYDWKILFHDTTAIGHPFVHAYTIAYRFVRDDERTFTPLIVHGALDPLNGSRRSTGVWLWEMEDCQAPHQVTSGAEDAVSNHEIVTIGEKMKGTVVGGFVTSVFDRNSAPIVTAPSGTGRMIQVPHGTVDASVNAGTAHYAVDGNITYGAFGGEWKTRPSAATGQWWEQTWDHAVYITHVTLATLFPWVLYNPHNPTSTLTLDDGTEYPLSATGNYQIFGADLERVHTVSGMRITFDAQVDEGGWNEVIAWYDDPDNGQTLQSADRTNNPIPYHGVFAGGGNALNAPWMYIGQITNDVIKAEIYNDLTGAINESPWSTVGASVVVPGLRARLPHIPWPLVPVAYQLIDSPGDELYDLIVETVTVVASGEGADQLADLYASGVRVYIDGQDISQYIFDGPSGVIDSAHNRWDDIDISQWVRSPGQHTVVVTTDEGEADVDTRFEVF